MAQRAISRPATTISPTISPIHTPSPASGVAKPSARQAASPAPNSPNSAKAIGTRVSCSPRKRAQRHRLRPVEQLEGGGDHHILHPQHQHRGIGRIGGIDIQPHQRARGEQHGERGGAMKAIPMPIAIQPARPMAAALPAPK